MHPLVGDLSNLKDVELENKINELTRKYFSTNNVDVRSQISAIIDTYKEQLSVRRQVEWQKMMDSRNKDLDKLIKVS